MSVDPLDYPVWSALVERHAAVALHLGGARRYDPGHGQFAAVRDRSAQGLADLGALVARHGDVALLEADPPREVPGTAIVSAAPGVQMAAHVLRRPPAPAATIVALDEADAPAMLVLATLTAPGPFFARTNRLGAFVGIKVAGRLVAMAGERLKPRGATEVSGVCTHPDHRGRGFAGALMTVVAERILARGERPFLHAYADNAGAIAMYRRLGFTLRREVTMLRLTAA